jgi:hypothetical protein
MSTVTDRKIIEELRERVLALHRRNIDLERQIIELRDAVAALLGNAPVKSADTIRDWLPPLSS